MCHLLYCIWLFIQIQILISAALMIPFHFFLLILGYPIVSTMLSSPILCIQKSLSLCVLPHSPACPVGLMRVHSSLTVSGSAWWPPPLPACGGWTGSAGAWVGVAVGGRAVRCDRRTGCPSGRGRARHCGSLGRNCSRRWGPQRRPPHCLEHHLPHCNTNTHTAHQVSLLSHIPAGYTLLCVSARSTWQRDRVNFDTAGWV